jgi:mRNA interferase MazF
MLHEEDGMPVVCALNLDHISLAQRDRIGALICTLPEKRWADLLQALLTACGFAVPNDD